MMLHALKAELQYFRIWLIGGLGIAAGITILMHVLKWIFNDQEGMPGFLPNMFLLIAVMVVAFVAQGTRTEEKRNRLLMAGSLTPRQIAGVTVLLPACLMGVGMLLTALKIGAASLLTGYFDLEEIRMTASLAGEFWAAAQFGPLACEATAARRQRRSLAGGVGWVVFFGGILVLAGSMALRGSIPGFLCQLLVLGASMAVALQLFAGRTDFTR
jgi:hypothetical protein